MATESTSGLLYKIYQLFDENNFPSCDKCSTDRKASVEQMENCIDEIKSFISGLEWELDRLGNIVLYPAYEFFHKESYALSRFQKRFDDLIKRYFDPENGLLGSPTSSSQQKIDGVHRRLDIFTREVDYYVRNTPGLAENIKLQRCYK